MRADGALQGPTARYEAQSEMMRLHSEEQGVMLRSGGL